MRNRTQLLLLLTLAVSVNVVSTMYGQSSAATKGTGNTGGNATGTSKNDSPADSAAPTTCTVPDASASTAGPAAPGAPGKSADKAGSAGTPATNGSAQTSGVQVTVNTVAAANSNRQPGSGGTPTVTSITTQALPLPRGTTNATQIASKLSTISKNVVSAIPVDPSDIVVTLNISKGADATKIFTQLREFIGKAAQPDPNVFAFVLPAGTGRACDVAHALIGSIPGITSITAVDDTRLLVSAATLDGSLEMRVKRLATQLATPTVPTAPKVDSIVQRLYYFHDPAAVATLINNAFPNIQAQAIQPDTMVLSDPADLDDDARHKALKSAQRTITRLDQPRPQVSVDAWSLQLSTTDEHTLGSAIPKLEGLAGSYNAAIDRSIEYGWNYLSQQIGDPENLDPMMLDYLTYTTRIARSNEQWEVKPWTTGAPPPPGTPPPPGSETGYGLGFASIYYPLTPNLVDMLVTFASLRYPSQAIGIVDEMETRFDSNGQRIITLHGPEHSCRERDADAYGIKDEKRKGRALKKTPPQTMQLECVYDALTHGLLEKQSTTATSALGQFRAALADFLFQYKLMVEYP